MGFTFSAGPKSNTKLTALDVVGCHLMVNGLQAGTTLCECVNGDANQVCGIYVHTSFMGRVKGLPLG